MTSINLKKIGSLVKVIFTGDEHHESDEFIASKEDDVKFSQEGDTYLVSISGKEFRLDAITDISLEDVPVTDEANFEERLPTVFPDPGGDDDTPGDDFLARNGLDIIGDYAELGGHLHRTTEIELDNKRLTFKNSGEDFLDINAGDGLLYANPASVGFGYTRRGNPGVPGYKVAIRGNDLGPEELINGKLEDNLDDWVLNGGDPGPWEYDAELQAIKTVNGDFAQFWQNGPGGMIDSEHYRVSFHITGGIGRVSAVLNNSADEVFSANAPNTEEGADVSFDGQWLAGGLDVKIVFSAHDGFDGAISNISVRKIIEQKAAYFEGEIELAGYGTGAYPDNEVEKLLGVGSDNKVKVAKRFPYEISTGFIGQSGTEDPIDVQFPGSTLSQLVWSRTAVGTYVATLPVEWPSGAIWAILGQNFTDSGSYASIQPVENTIVIFTGYPSEVTDGILNLTPYEIRVYTGVTT